MNHPQTSSDFHTRWSNYYEAVKGRPPRETLLKALDHLESATTSQISKEAIDLGCGDGRDTVELLRREWHVLAIDGQPEAIARLQHRDDVDLARLSTRVEPFEQLSLPEGSADLINASFCLPFCAPEAFPSLWSTIVSTLRSGGVFCGQLFGDRDSWAGSTVTLTRLQLESLLAPFRIVWLDEEDHPGKTALGEDKHWHIYNIVACKLQSLGSSLLL